MITKDNLYRLWMDLMIGILLALLVFNFPITAYELGQLIGLKIGEMAFEYTHPNPLGKIVYAR